MDIILSHKEQEINKLYTDIVIAELQRAKRARGAPWVIKFGKPSIPENLVMT